MKNILKSLQHTAILLLSISIFLSNASASNLYNISGSVLLNGNPVQGVTVVLTGTTPARTTTTNSLGSYIFSSVPSATSYTITPSKTGYTFIPAAHGGFLNSNTTHNFLAECTSGYQANGGVCSLQSFSISGGLGTTNAQVSITGGGYCQVVGASYSCSGIPFGSNVTITPTKTDFVFTPISKTFNNVTTNQVFNFSAEEDNFGDQGCVSVNIITERTNAQLGPGELRDYAMQAMEKLVTKAKRANRALGRRLARSATRTNIQLDSFVLQSQVATAQLPEIILLCPDTEICATVDNTALIAEHIKFIRELRNQIIRTLNRATRLTATSVKQARKMNRRFARTVKQTAKDLISNAQSIPAVRSVCTRG